MAENTNDLMIDAAGMYAAADTLGLSEDELVAAIKRKVAADRRQGLATTAEDVLSEYEELANPSKKVSHKGEFADSNPIKDRGGYWDDPTELSDAFGRDQDEFFVGERQFDKDKGTQGGWRDLGVEREGRFAGGLLSNSDMSEEEQRRVKERDRNVGGRVVSRDKEGSAPGRFIRSYETAIVDSPSGLGGVKDALRELRMGSDLYGYDAFPARTEAEVQGWRDSGLIPPNADYGSPLRSMASVESSLADSLEYGAEQRAVERGAVRELVDVDNTPFDENVALELQRRGQTPQALADKLASAEFGRRAGNLTSVENAAARVSPRSAAEQSIIASIGGINIGNIASGGAELRSMGDVQDLGQIKGKEPAVVVRNPDPSRMGTAQWQNVPGGNSDTGYWVDSRSGEILSYGEPEVVKPAEVNVPTSDQKLNAPSQPAVDWMRTQGPDWGDDGGLNFGKVTQADISGATADFSSRVKALAARNPGLYGKLSQVSGNVRSADEVAKLAAYILGVSQKAGKKFYTKERDPVTGKKSVIENPTIGDILRDKGTLDMSTTEEDILKNALYQLERAQETEGKESYLARGAVDPDRSGFPYYEQTDTPSVIMNAPEAVDSSRMIAEPAKVTGRGGGYERRSGTGRAITGIFKEAKSREAQQPFIGATADEGEAPVSRMRAGGLDPVEIRWQEEQRQGRNQKLKKNPNPKAKQKYLSVKGEIPRERVQEVRDRQVANALLTSEEIARRRAAGQSTGALVRGGRQSRPLPQHIWTTKDMAFDPSLRVGDIETRNRSDRAKAEVAILGGLMKQPPATSVSPSGGQVSTPPPTPQEPRVEAPTPSSGRPAPWHRGKKGNILGGLGIAGAAALGYVGGGMARDAWIENEAAARAAQ